MEEIDYTQHYLKYHDGSSANIALMERYFQASLREFLPPDRSQNILEIGCGAGFALGSLVNAGYRNVVGIDVDAGQVAAATSRGLPALHVPVDAQDAFVAKNLDKYSLIIAFDVLEHVPVGDQIRFVRNVRAMLKPEGLFVCQVPNALSPVASYQRYIDWTHHAAFTEDSLEFVIRTAGLVPSGVRESLEPVLPRTGLKGFLVRASKGLLRRVIRGGWRLVVLSELGVEVAAKHPVSRNIVMAARRA